MGKYIRKTKTADDLAVMDLSRSPLGVRTRARTLALKCLRTSSPSPAPAPPPSNGGGSYLQLRSRRLEKSPVPVHHESKRQKQQQSGNKQSTADQNPNPNPISTAGAGHGSGPVSENKVEAKKDEVTQENNNSIGSNDKDNVKDLGVEASFGENILDIEGRERGTRESTPCSLIRDPDAIRTPGSTTRPTSTIDANHRLQTSMDRHIPTAHEMDEFFAGAEDELQRQFIEKYNFDPVNDKPLPGRYEWEKVHP